MLFWRAFPHKNHEFPILSLDVDMLTGSCDVAKAERGPRPSHNIPYKADDRFIFRDDILARLESAYASVGHRRAGLFGMGGMG